MTWKKVKLGDLIENISVRAKDIGGGSNLPFYGVSNEDGITNAKYASEAKVHDYKVLEKSCFAYNPYRINVGSIALMEFEKTGLISPAYVVFKPKPKSIIPRLLLKFLKSSEGLRQIKQHARGTVRQALRFEDLCKIELSIPDFDDQKILFDRVSKAEKEGRVLDSELTHQLSLVKQLRQAFLREAMQGKLVSQDPNDEPTSELLNRIKGEKAQLVKEGKIRKEKELPPIKPEEIPFEIPKSWAWCRLGTISKLVTSGSRDWKKYYSKVGDVFIRSQNIREAQLDLTNRAFVKPPKGSEGQRTKVLKDDILITITGAGVSNSGLVDVVDWETAFVSQHVSLVRPMVSQTSKWLHLAIISDSVGKRQFSKLIYGDKPGLNLVQIGRLMIPFPSVQEQERIVTKLDLLINYCDEIEQNIKQSKIQNDQLLQQVLREALRSKVGANAVV